MSKHSKPGGGKGHSGTHQQGTQNQQCKWDGNIRVTSEVPIQLPKDFLADYHTGQEDNKSHNKQVRLVSWLTFAAVVVYAALTAWQGCETRKLVKTAQDTYDAADRPYLGINGITANYVAVKDGSVVNLGKSSTGAVAVAFTIEIKNFGQVPAENFRNDSDAVLAGKEISGTIPTGTKGGEVFPSESVYFPGHLGPPYYSDVISKKSTLLIRVHLSYSYASKKYEHCEKEIFNPDVGVFESLGVDCSPGWNQ